MACLIKTNITPSIPPSKKPIAIINFLFGLVGFSAFSGAAVIDKTEKSLGVMLGSD